VESKLKFTEHELDVILKILKHQKDWGQAITLEDTLNHLIEKIRHELQQN